MGFNLNDWLACACSSSSTAGGELFSDYSQTFEPNCFASPPNKSSDALYGSSVMGLSSGNSIWLPSNSSMGDEDGSSSEGKFFHSRIPGWMVWSKLDDLNPDSGF